jgi:Zn-finger nucleic acid-binding protein
LATTVATGMRCIVSCPTCKRQYDAAGYAAGSRFHCACGAVVEVPRFRPYDADVVRCSSCSAPRSKGASACEHCGADYTLRERDLNTVCPSCMTRVSDRSKYCHHCGTPIVVQGGIGQPTRLACPACGPRQKMHGRTFGEPPLAALECPGCAGLWLGAATFRILADRARDKTVSDPSMDDAAYRAPASDAGPGKAASFYRPCPECGKTMNRRNFGKRSGVVIDACKEHGLWFDATELGAILDWIRKGGEQDSLRRDAMEARHAERQARFKIERPTQADGQAGTLFAGAPSAADGFGGFLGLLLDL